MNLTYEPTSEQIAGPRHSPTAGPYGGMFLMREVPLYRLQCGGGRTEASWCCASIGPQAEGYGRVLRVGHFLVDEVPLESAVTEQRTIQIVVPCSSDPPPPWDHGTLQ